MFATYALALALASSPQLTITSMHPPAVHGTGFHAREHVRVVFTAPGDSRHRRVRVSRRGAFTTTFPNATYDRCSGFSIVATGVQGDEATVRRRPPPECAPS